MSIVENHMQDVSPERAENIPCPKQLARKANRFRQNQRPADPRTHDFEIAESHIPENFLQDDITVDGSRHLIFSTPDQFDLLVNAKTWYLDCTFKVIRTKDIFEQLWGVHTFVEKDDCIKQVSLAFVFMTRRRKKDYKKVLKKLKNRLPGQPRVEAFVLDFEAAVWQAIRSVFSNTKITGCVFHWTQAVWKKMQAAGLNAEYNSSGDLQKVVRRLLALPLLPAEHIPAAFQSQRQKSAGNEQLLTVFEYIQSTWIDSSIWERKDWSVYVMPVRTNNDCEGWHRRLNVRAQCPLPFYVLISLLYKEAEFVRTQVKLVSANKLKKSMKKRSAEICPKVMKTWEEYGRRYMSADKY